MHARVLSCSFPSPYPRATLVAPLQNAPDAMQQNMLLRLRRRVRQRPERKDPPRAPTEILEDTEDLISSSTDNSEEFEADPAISSKPHSRPTLAVSPPHHDFDVHEITSVPAPIPDTGVQPRSTDTTTFVTYSSTSQSTPVVSKTTHPHDSPKSTFIPLPFLQTLNLTESEEEPVQSSLLMQSTPTSEPTRLTPAGVGPQARPPQRTASPRLSATAIVALSVSVGLAVLVVVVLVKLIKRPRRRKTPTPSLPILQDGSFTDDKVEGEGSPIFGGKELSSPALEGRGPKGNTGLWTWTQYNSGIPKPAPIVTVTRSSSQGLGAANQPENHDLIKSDVQTHNQYPFTGYGSTNAASKNKSAAPLQPVQNAITRAVSRLSTVSMSLYPNSPGGYSQVGGDVGLAIDGAPLDDQSNLAALRYKERMMVSRNRTSMIAPGSGRDPAALRRSQSFAYGGMELNSPSPASPNRTQLNGGRARIKSTYYTPGSYSRTSTAPKHDLDREHFEQAAVQRSDSRRGRDLTSALGLASPIPPSPQPTLYPDDSMSVIGEAKKVTVTGRSQKKPVPKQRSPYDSPPSDTAALGSLMMVDFAGSKSTASLVNIRPSEAARARETQEGTSNGQMTGKSSLKKRVEDKPPRVPSPPPIPSLAQMALQHANPEGYADYHSPTYSIYGLYDGDRKSRGTSFGY